MACSEKKGLIFLMLFIWSVNLNWSLITTPGFLAVLERVVVDELSCIEKLWWSAGLAETMSSSVLERQWSFIQSEMSVRQAAMWTATIRSSEGEDLNRYCAVPEMPIFMRVDRTIWWLTVSKAAHRSSQMSTEDLESALASCRASVTKSRAVSVEWLLLKPDCLT